ncbi:hypothetical protein LTR72_012550, partial [Exophiala xenobiotica]
MLVLDSKSQKYDTPSTGILFYVCNLVGESLVSLDMVMALFQPQEFSDCPVKDVVVFEPLSAKQLVEHVPKVRIGPLILITQVADIIHVFLKLGG